VQQRTPQAAVGRERCEDMQRSTRPKCASSGLPKKKERWRKEKEDPSDRKGRVQSRVMGGSAKYVQGGGGVAFGQRQKHGTEKAIRAIRNDSGRRETVSRTIGVKLAWNACQGRLPLRREGLTGKVEGERQNSVCNKHIHGCRVAVQKGKVCGGCSPPAERLLGCECQHGGRQNSHMGRKWYVHGEILEGTGRWEHRTIGEELLSVLAMRLKA